MPNGNLKPHGFLKTSDLDQSIETAENSLKILKETNNKESIALAYRYLGVFQYLKKNYSQKLHLLNEGRKTFFRT